MTVTWDASLRHPLHSPPPLHCPCHHHRTVTLQCGMARFPNDATLLITLANFYIEVCFDGGGGGGVVGVVVVVVVACCCCCCCCVAPHCWRTRELAHGLCPRPSMGRALSLQPRCPTTHRASTSHRHPPTIGAKGRPGSAHAAAAGCQGLPLFDPAVLHLQGECAVVRAGIADDPGCSGAAAALGVCSHP